MLGVDACCGATKQLLELRKPLEKQETDGERKMANRRKFCCKADGGSALQIAAPRLVAGEPVIAFSDQHDRFDAHRAGK